MAGTQPQTPQATLASKPAEPKGQATGAAAQADSQPVFRDWAAI